MIFDLISIYGLYSTLIMMGYSPEDAKKIQESHLTVPITVV